MRTEGWKVPCSVCGKEAEQELKIGLHVFCNYGCMASYQINTKGMPQWWFDFSMTEKECTPDDEFNEDLIRRITNLNFTMRIGVR